MKFYTFFKLRQDGSRSSTTKVDKLEDELRANGFKRVLCKFSSYMVTWEKEGYPKVVVNSRMGDTGLPNAWLDN